MSTYWNFYLITGQYDDTVRERITQENRPVGVFLEKPSHRVWVKTWAEILRESEGRIEFVQEKLRIEVSYNEIEERISKLKSSILKKDIEDFEDNDIDGEQEAVIAVSSSLPAASAAP